MTKKEIANMRREIKDIEKRLRIQRNLSQYIPDGKTRGKVRRLITLEEKRTKALKAKVPAA